MFSHLGSSYLPGAEAVPDAPGWGQMVLHIEHEPYNALTAVAAIPKTDLAPLHPDRRHSGHAIPRKHPA